MSDIDLLLDFTIHEGCIKLFLTDPDQRANINLIRWIIGALLFVIVITIVAYYLTKYLMIREESRYPEIDRVWYEAMNECARLGIFLDRVPLFVGLGTPSGRFGSHLLKIAEINLSISVPKQGDSDISVFANSEAVFVFVPGCSCLSSLAAMPSEIMELAASPIHQDIGDGGRTIDPSFFAAQGQRDVSPTQTPQLSPRDMVGSQTLLLPEDQDFSELLRGDEPQAVLKSKTLSSTSIAECEDRLRHVCGLIKEARNNLCPINGILTTIPFGTIDTSSPQLQLAAQKDLATLRENLMVRCGNVLLITDMEDEDGFQELINRFGPQRSRDFRFGKGCQLWTAPESERLAAVGAHATGAFEDWIYMLFQDEKALQRRFNSRLFKLLCKMRGPFAKSLNELLARGFGYDPTMAAHLANEQFLFGGCYFAATGNDASRQAFVRSVVQKLIEQEGQLEWAPAARRIDNQFQFAANIAVLIGTASLLAIVIMLIIHFGNAG